MDGLASTKQCLFKLNFRKSVPNKKTRALSSIFLRSILLFKGQPQMTLVTFKKLRIWCSTEEMSDWKRKLMWSIETRKGRTSCLFFSGVSFVLKFSQHSDANDAIVTLLVWITWLDFIRIHNVLFFPAFLWLIWFCLTEPSHLRQLTGYPIQRSWILKFTLFRQSMKFQNCYTQN